jgi:hypothetical protein
MPEVRVDADLPVELVDPPAPVPVTADPLVPAGFVDGIQAALQVVHRDHRPVYLNYIAAGAVAADGRLLRIDEALYASGSFVDEEWFTSVGTSVPWRNLKAHRGDELPAEALSMLASTRDDAERELVEGLAATCDGSLVVDGSLTSRPVVPTLVGVVKTTRRRYLPDETLLWGMPAGYRSPRFVLPAGSQGVRVPRYSCYLRLHDANERAWDFGLIRLEAFDLELLEPLAAMALAERQSSRSRDSRYDRHLAGVRAVEDTLRAHRPPVFTL